MRNCGLICSIQRLRTIEERARAIKDRVYTRISLKEIGYSIENICKAKTDSRQLLISELAHEIIAESYTIEDPEPELRKFLAKVRLSISEQDKESIVKFDSFNEFRKNYFGKLNLVRKGLPVDVLYQELSTDYPWLFPSSIINIPDELEQIALVTEQIKPTKRRIYDKADTNGINEVKLIIWEEVKDMVHNIVIKFDIDQEVYMVVNDGTGKKKVESGKVKEVGLDKKGWHMHIGPRRYGMDSPLVFETHREAQEKVDTMNKRVDSKRDSCKASPWAVT